jgi:hypothetical protein
VNAPAGRTCLSCGHWSEYPDGHHPSCASRPAGPAVAVVAQQGVGRVPHATIPAKPGERRGPGHLTGAVSRAADDEVRRALVRQIAADPISVGWLREHVASQLRAAADELRRSHTGGITGEYAAGIVERRAAEHERGETPLW